MCSPGHEDRTLFFPKASRRSLKKGRKTHCTLFLSGEGRGVDADVDVDVDVHCMQVYEI